MSLRTYGLVARTGLVLLGALILGAGTAIAYESYHDPNLNDQGYCSTCHPGFAGGRSDVTHDLHTGGNDPVTVECNLCHTGSGRDNPFTMWSTGDNGDGLGCAGCHGRDYGQTIEQDYRGFTLVGLPKNSGWGLRAHHAAAGIDVCATCHLDGATNPPTADDGTPLPEDVIDPTPATAPIHYYLRSDVSLGGNPVDPCTNEDTANDADTEGLDNDGDDLYDTADPDCAVVVAGPGETSGAGLPMLLVTAHDPATSTMDLTFGVNCETENNIIALGNLVDVASYNYTAQVCGLGITGSFTWAGYPTSPDSFYFIVVGTKGMVQGSYGTSLEYDVGGVPIVTERPDDVVNTTCGMLSQDLPNRCD